MSSEKKEGDWFGLWAKDTKRGDSYLNGKIKINGVEYWCSIFENTRRTKDSHPHYNMVLNAVDESSTKAKKPSSDFLQGQEEIIEEGDEIPL